ncbi:hypothetical protein Tco_1543362, partial [Tanacetum coccineum]
MYSGGGCRGSESDKVLLAGNKDIKGQGMGLVDWQFQSLNVYIIITMKILCGAKYFENWQD